MWEMGGYGYFVWPSYAFVLLGLGWLMLASMKRAKIIRRQIKNQLEKRNLT